jgi:sec-independent protein translocase protein TatA
MELFQPWHIIIVVGLAVLFFGGKKLPELGKGLGEGLRGFKEGMKGIGSDDTPTPTAKPADNAHIVTPVASAKTDEPATKV